MGIRIPTGYDLGLGKPDTSATPNVSGITIPSFSPLIDKSAENQAWQSGIATLGKAVEDRAQELQTAKDKSEKSQAQVDLLYMQDDLQREADVLLDDNDKTFDDKNKGYEKALHDFGNKFDKKIPKNLQEELAPIKAATSLKARASFDDALKKRMNTAEIARGIETLDILAKRAAVEPETTTGYIKEMGAAAIEGMPISDIQKVKQKDEFLSGIDISRMTARFDAKDEFGYNTDLEGLLADIQEKDADGNYVNYPDIDPKTRIAFESDTKAEMNKNLRFMKEKGNEIREEAGVRLALLRADGKLTKAEILREAKASNLLGTGTANSIEGWMNTLESDRAKGKSVVVKTNRTVEAALYASIVYADDPADILDSAIWREVTNGNLTSDDGKQMIIFKNARPSLKNETIKSAYVQISKTPFSKDKAVNAEAIGKTQAYLREFIKNNPTAGTEDIDAFTEKILEPVKSSTISKAIDFFAPGTGYVYTPLTETSVKERQAAKEAEIKQMLEKPKGEDRGFVVGQVYKNAQGVSAKYIGDGKWQKVK